MSDTDQRPKLFISYAWSSPEHEERVMTLAKELTESAGVHVIIDKWDLREGQDPNAFMESMVNDSEIKKVALICDQTYVEKSDARTGGAGTEAQIISKEIYNAIDQQKFVAVIFEKSESEKASVPTFYTSRIYIDLSSDEAYSANYEQLVRWVYDKPLHTRPEIGKKPDFLDEAQTTSFGTAVAYRRAIDAVKNHRTNTAGLVREYFDQYITALGTLQIENFKSGNIEDRLYDSIVGFEPTRNEYLSLLASIVRYDIVDEVINEIHGFLERSLHYLEYRNDATTYSTHPWSQDNYRFVLHELFLYTVAILTKHECFDSAARLLSSPYYVSSERASGLHNFTVFDNHIPSLDQKYKKLKNNHMSPHCDLLYKRCPSTGLHFDALMQADFVCFTRAGLKNAGRWWPDTLLKSYESNGFELFTRSEAIEYFDKSKVILGAESKEELTLLLEKYDNPDQPGGIGPPSWGFQGFIPSKLMNFEKLATM